MKTRSLQSCFLILTALLVGVAAALGIHQGNALEHFEEDGFITAVSVLLLLGTSVLAGRIWRIRRRDTAPSTKRSSVIWALLTIGFFFLALDELLELHESLDHVLHAVFNIEETGTTDRLDDLLVGLYGLAGLGVLYAFRAELRKYRTSLPYLIAGFVLLTVMVALDVLTNRPDILSELFDLPDSVRTVYVVFCVAEEAFKLLAEGSFVASAHAALQVARTAPGDN
jgi:hypothetical protein